MIKYKTKKKEMQKKKLQSKYKEKIWLKKEAIKNKDKEIINTFAETLLQLQTNK